MEGFKISMVKESNVLCEVKKLKINNTAEHDVNSVLEGFKKYFSMLEKLVKIQPKAPNKYSTSSAIKNFEHMIQSDHFNLVSISKISILTILKTTQSFKSS